MKAGKLFLTLLAMSPCLTQVEAEPRREIAAAQPLFLFQTARPEALAQLPPAVRPLAALHLNAMQRTEKRSALEEQIERARQAGVSVALHIRTHFPIRTPADCEGRVTSPETLAQMLDKHPNVIAVINAEQYAFTREPRDYLAKTLQIAAERGVYYIFDAGWSGGCNWDDVAYDRRLRELIAEHRRLFIPMWEMNITKWMYTQHSQLLGWWLAEWCEHWGANPQRWFWGEAGFGKLGEKFSWRFIGHGGMKAAAKTLDHFPLYGQMVALTALTGATVFWIGGEIPPTMFNADGSLSGYGQDTLGPLMERLVEWELIPTRAQVQQACPVAAVNPRGAPFGWDEGVARTGQRSLRLDCGAGSARRLAWTNDGFIPVEPGQRYLFSAWARTRQLNGEAHLRVGYYNGQNWVQAESKPVTQADDWAQVAVEGHPPEGYAHGLLFLVADAMDGTIWFDDVHFGPEGKPGQLAPNPSFEEAREGGVRPLGWLPASLWGAPETERCERGANALWHATYGLRHEAECIPNDGRRFPIAWLPFNADEATRGKFARVLELGPDLRPEDVRQRLAGLGRPVNGFGFAIGDALFMGNSHENEDVTETVRASFGGLRFTATLPVHSYVIVQRKGNALRIIAEGRRDRVSALRIEGAPLDVKAAHGRVLAERQGGSTHLTFPHSDRKVGWVVLGP